MLFLKKKRMPVHQELESHFALQSTFLKMTWALITAKDEEAADCIVRFIDKFLLLKASEKVIGYRDVEKFRLILHTLKKIREEQNQDFNLDEWIEKNSTFQFDQAKGNLILNFQGALPSAQAMSLVQFIKTRKGWALHDDGRELWAIMLKIPIKSRPPNRMIDRQSTNYSHTYSAFEKMENLIELIIWADAEEILSPLDHYLRYESKWLPAKRKKIRRLYGPNFYLDDENVYDW